jgi:hypothetical protein
MADGDGSDGPMAHVVARRRGAGCVPMLVVVVVVVVVVGCCALLLFGVCGAWWNLVLSA